MLQRTAVSPIFSSTSSPLLLMAIAKRIPLMSFIQHSYHTLHRPSILSCHHPDHRPFARPVKFSSRRAEFCSLVSSAASRIHESSSTVATRVSGRETKAQRRAARNSPEGQLRVKIDMCSKSGDLTEALRLYDEARRDGIPVTQHLYNVLLYLCSSSNAGSFSDLGLKRGFEIFQQMVIDKIDPNEATFTNAARLAAGLEDPDMAFDLVKQMKNFDIPPKLRSYGPALFGYCEKEMADKGYEVYVHMNETGVVAEEAEISALLKVSAGAEKGGRVYEMIHRLRATVRRHELGGGAARNSDADHYHHRLSLQLNKENMTPSEEVVISRIKARLQGRELKPEEETRSPRQYAKQIVKQVKESVSRRVGLDITNTVKNRENPEKRGGRRDSDLVAQIKSRKKKVLPRVAEEEPVDLFPVVKQQNEKPKSVYYRKDHHVLDEMPQSRKQSFSTAEAMFSNPATPVQKINVAVKPRRQGGIISLQEKEQPAVVGKKSRGKRMPPQTSDLIRNKKEEPFVRPTTATRGGNIPDKRCRKTPLSSELPSLILPVKKDPAPPATNLPSPKKQVGLSNAQDSKRSSSPSSQLPSNPSHTASYRLRQEEATRPVPSQENSHQDNDAAATAEAAAEEEYITRILKRTGIDRDTAVSFTNWFSPTHPLDPTIFYHLEHITTATTTPPPASGTVIPPYNRKLIFHLVDEILAGILQPYMNVVPWTTARSSDILNNSDRSVTGSDLVEALCKRIRSFPSADCQVLEDIDALIDKDFSDRPELQWRETAVVEEEVEGILTEVETELLDSLIHETALDIILKAQPNSISPFLGFGAGSRRSHGVT